MTQKTTTLERWISIQTAWLLYKQQPSQPDSLVHFLIMLDSFITYVNELGFDSVVLKAKDALSLIESFSEPLPKNITDADNIMAEITKLVKATSAPNYVRSQVKPVSEDLKPATVVLCWSNQDEAEDLAAQMEHYGYDILITSSPSKMAKTAISKRASLAILDVSTEKYDTIQLLQVLNLQIPV